MKEQLAVLKFFISFATKLSIYPCIINFNLNSSYVSVYLIYNRYYDSFITVNCKLNLNNHNQETHSLA